MRAVAALALVGCGPGDTGDTAASCDTAAYDVTWDGWGDGFFSTYCRACHSSGSEERYGAPESVNFDTRADVVQWRESIRRTVLEDATMPVGGGVYDDDLLLLDLLLTCGL